MGWSATVAVRAGCAAAALAVAAAASNGQDAPEQRTRAQAQGEAPASPDRQEGRTPARATRVDVRQHLDRMEQMLEALLVVAPPGGPIAAEEERDTDEPARVGTAGTPVTPRTGQTVVVERAKLEALRLHVRQAREALRQLEAR